MTNELLLTRQTLFSLISWFAPWWIEISFELQTVRTITVATPYLLQLNKWCIIYQSLFLFFFELVYVRLLEICSWVWNSKKSKHLIFPAWTTSSTSYEKAILICHLAWSLLQEKSTAELPTTNVLCTLNRTTHLSQWLYYTFSWQILTS